MNQLTPVEYFKKRIDYNTHTGIFTWKKRPREDFKSYRGMETWNSRFAGKTAGRLNNGYLEICFNYKTILAHRLAWFMSHGYWPNADIDHINGNRADNKPENLRLATRSQNKMNVGIVKSNTSGFKGVSWCKRTRKWYAYIKANGAMKNLGRYDNIEEAASVAKLAREKYHGEFANHG